jgi:hypothetical protein
MAGRATIFDVSYFMTNSPRALGSMTSARG